MSAEADLPQSHFDFADPEFLLDPYPIYKELRDAGPVVFHAPTGQYLVAGYKDCARTLGNAKAFGQSLMFSALFGGTTMIVLDGTAHSEVRGIWREDFQRPSLEAQRALVTRVVDAKLKPFAEQVRSGATVNAVTAMTRSIPTTVIAELLGVPGEDQEDFSNWSDEMVAIAEGFYDSSAAGAELVRRGEAARDEMNQYLRARLSAGGDESTGLIGTMIASEVGRGLDLKDAVAQVTQLVFAGNETTAILLATALYVLAEHPDQRDLLRADRSLIPQALEELLRWNSVAPAGWRVVRAGGAQIGDCRLPEDAVVVCLQGAANRDPRRWENPDAFDVMRPPQAHVGFGFGPHSCLGLNLTRLEAEIWLDHLLDELPEWDVDNVDWGSAWVARGPRAIDVHL